MELDVDTINAEGPVVLQMDGNTKEQLTLVPESGATVDHQWFCCGAAGQCDCAGRKGSGDYYPEQDKPERPRDYRIEVENLEPVTVQKQLASGSWIAQENAKTEGITLLANPTAGANPQDYYQRDDRRAERIRSVDGGSNTKTITPTGKSGTATIVIRPQNASTHDAVEIPVTIVAVQNSQDKDFTPGREFEELGGKVGIEEATVAIGFPEPGMRIPRKTSLARRMKAAAVCGLLPVFWSNG